MVQLELFEEFDDLQVVRSEIKSVKESCNKVRKGMFARHNELAKMLMDISSRLETLERNICQGTRL